MTAIKKLTQVAKNTPVMVNAIAGDALRSKLLELGLTKGSCVTVLYEAPLGDPIAVDVEGFVLSLRLSEADLIEVEF